MLRQDQLSTGRSPGKHLSYCLLVCVLGDSVHLSALSHLTASLHSTQLVKLVVVQTGRYGVLSACDVHGHVTGGSV